MAKRWRVEKITRTHGAYINCPEEFPLGCWYVTDDPDEVRTLWTEFVAPTHAEAIARIYER